MIRPPQESRGRPLTVCLVGPDIAHLAAGGGTAVVSKQIVQTLERSDAIRVIPVRNYYSLSLIKRATAAVGAMMRIVALRRCCDVVHVQVTGGWSIERDLPLAILTRMLRRSLVIQFHGAGQADDYRAGAWLHKAAYRMLIRASNAVVVLGDNAANWIKSVEPTARVAVIRNGVVVGAYRAPPVSPTVNILFVGRLGARKGVYDLLEAMKRVCQVESGCYLQLAGDGDVERVMNEIDRSDLLREHVQVLGWRSREDIERLLNEATALVLPSYAEGMPMALLEAMASGRAVIASRVDEVDQVVTHDVNGMLIKPGDIEALSAAILRVCRDRESVVKMGLAGHERATRDFSLAAMVENLGNVWREAAKGLGR